MAQMNPRVIAAIDLARARTADELARLEAVERSSTTIGRSSGAQIARQRRLKELRSQVKSWERALELVRGDGQVTLVDANGTVVAVLDDVDAEKEFPPERSA